MDLASEISDVSFGRPHVVILGAGASLAAVPRADRYGNRAPLMNNIVDAVGLRLILEDHGISPDEINFEELYSDLAVRKGNKTLLNEIEKTIYEYFNSLALPKHPTIYDHLVLSLRPKDLIATFNWDPFLYQACARNHKKATLPRTAFLHGCAKMGYCLADRKHGLVGLECSMCGKMFTPSQLLYPIKQKNYSNNEYIKMQWDILKLSLKNAYILTIFGYSAPKTDVEALKMMKDAWGDPSHRELEEIEIIDIKSEDELCDNWGPFIHSHHYRTTDNFYKSWIARHPRRTCEVMWSTLMECDPAYDNLLPANSDFEELWNWYEPLLLAEPHA